MWYSPIDEVWEKPKKSKKSKKTTSNEADPTCELIQRGNNALTSKPYEDPNDQTPKDTFGPYQISGDHQVYRLTEDHDDVYLDEAMRNKYRIKPEYEVKPAQHDPLPNNATWQDIITAAKDTVVQEEQQKETDVEEEMVACEESISPKELTRLMQMVEALQIEVHMLRTEKEEQKQFNYFDYGIFIVAGILLIMILEQMIQIGFRISHKNYSTLARKVERLSY